MNYYRVSYSNIGKRGQLKIQEMAFVLVALMIFFGLVALFYFSIRLSDVREDAALQREAEAQALVRKLSASPEFAWTATSCTGCIDMDKVLLLKERQGYKGFWELEYLSVEVIAPQKEGECRKENYPDCRSITIVNKSKEFGTPVGAFVALCKQEFNEQGYVKCELGKIYASGRRIRNEG